MFLRFPIPNLSSYLRPEKIAFGYLDIQHLLEKENTQHLKIFGTNLHKASNSYQVLCHFSVELCPNNS